MNSSLNSQKTVECSEIALVTGASRGIGRFVALDLAATGRHILINYIKNEAAAKDTLCSIENAGGSGEIICFDVADRDQTETTVKNILEKHKKIDILVNNAGITDDTLMVRMKPEKWQRVLDTNLTGFYNVTRFVVKSMIRKNFGRIVNITSTSGQMGQAGQVNYSASKAGLIGATKALSREVSSRNITVNAVSPGFIDTEMVKNLSLEEIAKTIPMKRAGTPREVASAVTFFCSHQASYITGQVLGVNGGIA
ncbi:3-oxoacyl-[acyl-carrier-protein] reductase [Desulfocicer vacuolatum DSM 3385]|uniref:3-oxoacyl-[acyl-carrier-protein] reductase n=1 Tax=Desulfocicer vacuolatum DSM 3385 TaxID=1121400 RepID=A0A1W2A6I9_9BACT|nr:3-oxoacyl-[acyl-carrier-protein] reductase [Desulfocicer vacuolatum]SMC56304.1 3-oxoacyl-[acyl-carrier-protein] reductase [Desulfocicer vacuolatum DSM 3385]